MSSNQSLAGFLLFCLILGVVTFVLLSVVCLYKFTKLLIEYCEHRRMYQFNYTGPNPMLTSAVAEEAPVPNVRDQRYTMISV